jgi:hypothetical protein
MELDAGTRVADEQCMILLTLTLLTSAQAAEDALREPDPQQVPMPFEGDVPVNSALILLFAPDAASLITVDELGDETATPLDIDDSLGALAVVRLPEQPANATVVVRRDQQGFTQDVSWSTGTRRIGLPSRAPRVLDSSIDRPPFARARARVVLDADPARAALVVRRANGELVTVALAAFGGTPTEFVDFEFDGDEEYSIVSVDRTGAASEPASVVVAEDGGCSASRGAASIGVFALLLSARRRRAA